MQDTSKFEIKKYDPASIESKWQKIWEKEKIYKFKDEAASAKSSGEPKEKYYPLVEWPYPSGDLHIGHWFSFATADVHARVHRMIGKNVFFTNGFDAFGLPAENAAIKRGIHPKDWTMSNIENMRKQFSTMGTMIDWSHEAIACLPEYYKWNQWIFIEMFKKGLAYRGKAWGNWCPKDMTVLANEHVENGKCWRCGTEVVQKEIEQWFIKLTAYADKLIWEDNPAESPEPSRRVDWPVSVRVAQNQWIGKKVGMKIKHKVIGADLEFETFTAFPAWSWADTFIVIAPEHPLVKQLVKGTDNEKQVMDFVEETAKITTSDRNEEKFEKKGVFTGKYAKDPFGGKDMPIWLANFALLNFGTGIIRCSGHDPRDIEFAKKYGIKIKEVVDRVNPDEPVNAHTNKGILKDSGPFTGKEVSEIIPEVVAWIEKQGIGKRHVNYHIHDWSISRQRYWGTPVPMIHCPKCGIVPVPEKDLPVELPYNVDFTPKGKPPLATAKEWLETTCPTCAGKAQRDPETLDTFFDSSWYFFRYLNPHYEKGPFPKDVAKQLTPVDIYFGGAEHTLGHTLYARFFTRFFKEIGLIDFEEFAKKRVQHGVILGPDGNRMSKSKGNVINPDDIVKEYGADAVRLYLGFMMPYDATAPWNPGGMWGVYRFLKRVWDLQNKAHSLSSRPASPELQRGEPSEQPVEAPPLDTSKKIVPGESGKSLYGGSHATDFTNNSNSTVSVNSGDRDSSTPSSLGMTKQDLFEMHTAIKKVADDAGSTKFNTAVSTLMKWLNHLSAKETITLEEYKTFLLLLAPFAPHMTEEIWQNLQLSVLSSQFSEKGESVFSSSVTERLKTGNLDSENRKQKTDNWSIHQQSWPVFDKQYLQEDEVTIVIQVNGKVRDNINIQYLISNIKYQKEIENIAKESEKIKKYLEGKKIIKSIYIPGKVLNFVIQ